MLACNELKAETMNHVANETVSKPAFHEGEIAIQKRLGVDDKLARVGPKYIRTFMPDQHRQFFQQLPFILIGGVDHSGHPWSTHLSGHPGFIQSPTDRHLHIQATLPHGDPLTGSLSTDHKIGMLGIELPTRRRNRLNGSVSKVTSDALSIHVEQSFGNCPQYIHPRTVELTAQRQDTKPVKHQDSLSDDLIDVLKEANIFFIASRSADLTDDTKSGIDISHRGGEKGFVHILDETTLIFPDYPGNRFFNTLGNIQSDPRIGLLFFDFKNSRTVQIKANATILWTGNERDVQVDIKEVVVNANTTIKVREEA